MSVKKVHRTTGNRGRCPIRPSISEITHTHTQKTVVKVQTPQTREVQMTESLKTAGSLKALLSIDSLLYLGVGFDWAVKAASRGLQTYS